VTGRRLGGVSAFYYTKEYALYPMNQHVYHDNPDCWAGSDIKAQHLRQGKGRKVTGKKGKVHKRHLCHLCDLERKFTLSVKALERQIAELNVSLDQILKGAS
jgi:hypothetical protein